MPIFIKRYWEDLIFQCFSKCWVQWIFSRILIGIDLYWSALRIDQGSNGNCNSNTELQFYSRERYPPCQKPRSRVKLFSRENAHIIIIIQMDGQTDGQMDGQMDGHHQAHYPPALQWFILPIPVHGYNRSGAKYLTALNKILILRHFVILALPSKRNATLGPGASMTPIWGRGNYPC